MAIRTPTRDQIESNLFNTTVANLNLPQAACNDGLIAALSKAFAYELWSAYECSNNLGYTPLDATGQRLEKFAELCGIERLDETTATGYITVNGSGSIPAGTILTRCDGVQYEVLRDVDVPSVFIPVFALEAGTQGNAPANTTLTIESAIAGLNSNAFVSQNGIAGGQAVETDTQFRERLLACYANPCRTGTISDYDYWTRLYNGVTSVQVIPRYQGPGTVKVCFAMQETYVNGIPIQQDVENVQEILNENSPAGVKVTACPAIEKLINVRVRLLDSNSVVDRQNITNILTNLFSRIEIGQFCVADIYNSVSSVYTGCFEIVTPTNNLFFDECELPVLGTVSFVT